MPSLLAARWLRALLVVAMVGGASRARAWEVSLRVASEITFRGSTATSQGVAQAEQAQGPRRTGHNPSGKGALAGMQCQDDDECYGWCVNGRCADGLAPAVEPGSSNQCSTDQACGPGRICRDFLCEGAQPVAPSVVSPPEPAPEPILKCAGPQECRPGKSCIGGQCLSPPPPPPSSLWRRGSELYLKERVVQLRQDLALGEGPVVATLAEVLHGLPAAQLGPRLRAHRAELLELVGDGAQPGWADRFLRRVEALNQAGAPAS